MTDLTDTKNSERYSELDFLRAAACLMVVIVHASSDYFYSAGHEWIAANVYDSMVRCAVPLFFMLSGALLMKRAAEEPVADFVKKRYMRILAPFLFWGSIGALLSSPAGVADFLGKLFCSYAYFHLWYLYLMVGLYLLLPVIGKWYAAASDREKIFYLSAWAVVCCFSLANGIFNAFTGGEKDFLKLYHLREMIGGTWYFVLGAFLFDNRESEPVKRIRPSLYLLCFVAVGLLNGLSTYLLSTAIGKHSEVFYPYRSPLVVAAAASFFAFAVRSRCGEWRAFPFIRFVSAYSLGIYCIHGFISELVTYDLITPFIGICAWVVIPAKAVVVFTLALAVACIMKKIPFLRRVV